MKKTDYIAIIFLALFGGFSGSIMGFIITYCTCLAYDFIIPPQGNGGGLFAIGWAFLMLTVPVGALYGGIKLPRMYRRMKIQESNSYRNSLKVNEKEDNRTNGLT